MEEHHFIFIPMIYKIKKVSKNKKNSYKNLFLKYYNKLNFIIN